MATTHRKSADQPEGEGETGRASPLLAAVTSTTLKDRIVDFILFCILRGEPSYYKPGNLISESTVAKDYRKYTKEKISRVPVREAFSELIAAQFLTAHKRRGTEIRRLETSDIAGLLRSRLLLEERVAVELVLRRGKASLDEVVRINNELTTIAQMVNEAKGTTDESLRQFVRGDSEFHAHLAEIAGLSEVASTLRRIRRLMLLAAPMQKAYETGWMSSAVEEHAEIIRALRPVEGIAGDPERVKAAVRKHIANSTRRWIFHHNVYSDLAELYKPQAAPSPADVARMISVRVRIESLVAKDLAASRTPPERAANFIKEMQRVIGQARSEHRAGEVSKATLDAFGSLDLCFHCALVDDSNYVYLLDPLRHIWKQMFGYAAITKSTRAPLKRMDVVVSEHQRIVSAILAVQIAESPDERENLLRRLEQVVHDHIKESFNRWKEDDPERKLDDYEAEYEDVRVLTIRAKPTDTTQRPKSPPELRPAAV